MFEGDGYRYLKACLHADSDEVALQFAFNVAAGRRHCYVLYFIRATKSYIALWATVATRDFYVEG